MILENLLKKVAINLHKLNVTYTCTCNAYFRVNHMVDQNVPVDTIIVIHKLR